MNLVIDEIKKYRGFYYLLGIFSMIWYPDKAFPVTVLSHSTPHRLAETCLIKFVEDHKHLLEPIFLIL